MLTFALSSTQSLACDLDTFINYCIDLFLIKDFNSSLPDICFVGPSTFVPDNKAMKNEKDVTFLLIAFHMGLKKYFCR